MPPVPMSPIDKLAVRAGLAGRAQRAPRNDRGKPDQAGTNGPAVWRNWRLVVPGQFMCR